MARIGTFQRTTNQTLAEARDGTDTIAAWENSDGVTVTVTVMTYPRREDAPATSGSDSIRVAEYWLSVDGSENHDGAGPEAPFEGVHSTISGAKDAARDVMADITSEVETDE